MFKGSYILGLDTSCDETSAAVLQQDGRVLSNVISSQIKIHAPHGGVVPELASRAHAENISFVVEKALEDAKVKSHQIEALAVTNFPGLIGCLLTGVSFAKAFCFRQKIPLYAVDHLQGHLFSPFIEKEIAFPFLGLVVSGGHTAFYKVSAPDEVCLIGQTVDDAAGEAFDKMAKMIGLDYPGGPVVDRLARQGDDKAFAFTISKVKAGEQYMSFSGLKTAVYHHWQSLQKPSEQTVKDLCASYQKAVVKTLVQKTKYFLQTHDFKSVALSGGVAMNSRLREDLNELCVSLSIKLFKAEPSYCTDNGAMIAHVPLLRHFEDERETVVPRASQKIQARKLKK